MAIDRRQLGDNAEARAAQMLIDAGLTILHRNFRARMGEIDLVARHEHSLVIAEVRMRSATHFGGPGASINWAKRQRIVRTTRHLLARYPSLQKLTVRFDALLVSGEAGPIEWIKGAFDAF